MNQRDRVRRGRNVWAAELARLERVILERRMAVLRRPKIEDPNLCQSCESQDVDLDSTLCSYCVTAKWLREILYETRPDLRNDFTAHSDTLVQIASEMDGQATGLRLVLMQVAAELTAEGNRRRNRT